MSLKFWMTIALVSCLAPAARAQIAPDDTLGEQRSRFTPDIVPGVDLIDGGAQRGTNLFHSFSQFNINAGQQVYFANPSNVQNILTRVTGSTASNIQGLLGVAGNANFFLLNPNGIIFGANAQLDVRGSFVGSTANAIQFGNQGTFSATNPQAPPLLTVQPSAFLFTQLQSGTIQSQAQLTVDSGQSLVLLGGEINLNDAALTAPDGRIELGGLSAPGTVDLAIADSTFRLAFPENTDRANLTSNNSGVNAQGNTGGSILINARNIALNNKSFITTGIFSDATGSSDSPGSININATETINLQQESEVRSLVGLNTTGRGGDITIDAGSIFASDVSGMFTLSLAQGDAGNITLRARDRIEFSNGSGAASILLFAQGAKAGNLTVSTGSLSLTNGSILGSLPAFGLGESGSVTIDARDQILVQGVDSEGDPSGILSTLAYSEGKGGDLTINTGSLTVSQGGVIATGTVGEGDAGTLTINARDTISVSQGVISSAVAQGAEGNGGDINLTTGSLFLTNNGYLSSASQGIGNSGNITVKARDAIVIEGTQTEDSFSGILTTLVPNLENLKSEVEGGDINLEANSLTMNDSAYLLTGNIFRIGNAGDITINVRGNITLSNSSQINSFTFGGQGDAGRIQIRAGNAVSLDNSGILSASVGLQDIFSFLERLGFSSDQLLQTSGQDPDAFRSILSQLPSQVGNANDLEITARSLRLDNDSSLFTSSGAGDGGNIRLRLSDSLIVRRGSRITTDAGILELGGNGGDIEIDSRFIVAVPQERSRISANAFTGRGGNVQIQTEGLFGLALRSTPPNFRAPNDFVSSQITASSQLGIQGNISITQPDVQPTQEMIELPGDLIDASTQIAQVCHRGVTGRSAGRFVVSGRGSVPPSPIDPLSGTSVTGSLAEIESEPTAQIHSTIPIAPPEIIEAQGWIKSADGKVLLVAHSTEATPSSRPNVTCATATH